MSEAEIGRQFEGKQLLSSDGERVGTVTQTYKDSVSGEVEWLLFEAGLLDERELLVPVAEIEIEDDALRVPYTADVIREQPEVEAQSTLSADALSILASYFGLGSEGEADWNPVKI
jgi:hypothetical protein